jgi:hypothetical protein
MMKMYKNHIRMARNYLNAGMPENYRSMIEGLIRSARSDRAAKYLKDELDFGLLAYSRGEIL